MHQDNPYQTAPSVSEQDPELNHIMATPVSDDDRDSFLPTLFGSVPTGQHQLPAYLFAENLIYHLLRKMTPDYQGDFWHFYRLSNGSGYMAPSTDRTMLLTSENGYQGQVSADAAGIVVTLYAFSHLLMLWSERQTDVGDMATALHERFHGLRDFALAHPQCNAILNLID